LSTTNRVGIHRGDVLNQFVLIAGQVKDLRAIAAPREHNRFFSPAWRPAIAAS